MLRPLNPTDADIELLALAETDAKKVERFRPFRWGLFGNLALLFVAGGLGFCHALLAAVWRRAISLLRRGANG